MWSSKKRRWLLRCRSDVLIVCDWVVCQPHDCRSGGGQLHPASRGLLSSSTPLCVSGYCWYCRLPTHLVDPPIGWALLYPILELNPENRLTVNSRNECIYLCKFLFLQRIFWDIYFGRCRWGHTHHIDQSFGEITGVSGLKASSLSDLWP